LFVAMVSVARSRPVSYEIQNVPYHRQINDYTCGCASMEMVFEHYGPDIDQRAIIDVARTSYQEGTLSFDLIRTGHFSEMSSPATTNLFPQEAPVQGWDSRPIGYAGFDYRTYDECWVDDLKNAIAQDFPLILLMNYAVSEPGGHYRVAIGYDDSNSEGNITFLDPWDRTGQPEVVYYSTKDLCTLWNYTETNNDLIYAPFYAASLFPWTVDVSTSNQKYGIAGVVNIKATITYPQPPSPLQADISAVINATATIYLPSGMRLVNGQLPTIPIGEMDAGDSVTVKWQALMSNNYEYSASSMIRVDAAGIISGYVPDYFCCNSTAIVDPGYSYMDLIGGSGQVVGPK